ncbi:hypothetical protein ABEB36_014391 [Hypothenemus hampei]|uniref:Uncharacterized protein n=1 Tax=Hypothenemus hampei TaxID=57062 RepID=A0ABD1E4C1_HYPHA
MSGQNKDFPRTGLAEGQESRTLSPQDKGCPIGYGGGNKAITSVTTHTSVTPDTVEEDRHSGKPNASVSLRKLISPFEETDVEDTLQTGNINNPGAGKTELGQIQGSPDSRPEISPVSGEGAGKIEVGAACRFLTIFDERSSMEAEDEIIGKAQDEVNRKLQRQRTYTAGTSTPIEILGSDSEGETETPADIYLPVQAQLNPQVHEPGSNTGIKDIAADDTSMENWIKGLVRATGKKTTQADQIQNLEEARGLKELARKRFREHTPPHPFFTINKKKKREAHKIQLTGKHNKIQYMHTKTTTSK